MPFSKPATSTCRTRWTRTRWIQAGLAGVLALSSLAHAVRADTPDEQWAFASGLYNQKLWGLASQNLDKFLKANPRDPHAALASYQLAAAILRNEDNGKIDYARGAAAYEKALQQFPDPKLAPAAYFELADAYFNLNKFEAAASTYARFVATKPKPDQAAEALYMQGESLYAVKKSEPARTAYAQVLKDYPQSRPAPYAALALGTLAEDAGQMAQAASAYQNVWQKYPQSDVVGEARLRGASAFLALSQWDKARQGFEAVLGDARLAKWKRTALEGVADAQFGLKNWPGAADSYQKALAEPKPTDPKITVSEDASLQQRLADSLFNAKDWTRAAQSYGSLTNATDAVAAANALYFRGRARSEAGDKAGAQADFSALLQRFPTQQKAPRAALLLGDLKTQAKDAAGAAQAYQLVISKFPKSPEAKDAQAALLDLVGSVAATTSTGSAVGGASTSGAGVPSALENVLRALPPGRAASGAREKLARAAFDRGDWAQASTLAQGALDAKPDAATQENALYLLGSAQLNANHSTQAAAAFERLLAANSRSTLAPSAQLGLAWARLDLKQWSAAQAAARAGLEAVASSSAKGSEDTAARLKLALGEAQWRGKSYAPAAATLTGFASSDKEMVAQAAFFAASADESLSKWKEAAAQWAKYTASAKEPGEQARGQLKRGLALLKNPDAASKTSAQAAFESAVALDPKGETGARALYESAWAATEAKSAGAGALWEQLARDFPTSKYASSAQFQIAESLFAQKKWDEAAQAYAQVTKSQASEDAPLAWYQMGSALFNAQKWSEASAAFEHASSFPKSDSAQESLFWAGQSQLKGQNLKAARPFFERFLSGAAASTDAKADWRKWVAPARLGLGRALVESGENARAEGLLRQVAAGAANSSAAEANFELAQALFAQSKWKEASEAALKVTTLFGSSEWAPQSAWIAAQATEKSGDKASATALYRAIAQAQPPSQWATQAQERLKALGAG